MNRTLKTFLAAALAAGAGSALADDAWSTLNSYETVTVNAPAERAWETINHWDALQSWCPAFEKTEIVSGGTAVGSIRAITLDKGPTFTEELLAVDPDARTMQYKIVDSPLPIVEYVSGMRVVSLGKDESAIIWYGSYKRRTKDNPGPDANDDAMMKLVGGLYKACLGNAKKVAEAK
ncbi:MAG: SRPBCC family protein [Betaproteobacteria bacterium]